MKNLIHGVGVNDSKYPLTRNEFIDGKSTRVWSCKIYQAWKNMLCRCYCDKYQSIRTTYKGCSVCEEWLTFSNFKRWVQDQDWEGKQLDKDIIVPGNKVYSPETCAFVSRDLNYFILDSPKRRGQCPIGVRWHARDKKYHARCNNPFTRQYEWLGMFDCPKNAHLTWKRRKHELACQYADMQTDPRVAEALRKRYA